jgi:ribonuclease Y
MSYGFFQKELFTQNVDVMRSTFKLDYNSMHAIGAFLYTVAGRLADRENLEKIAKSHPGVANAFAVQAGRDLRVVVDPDAVGDMAAADLAAAICRDISAQLRFPGMIRVTVVRELRCVEYAR